MISGRETIVRVESLNINTTQGPTTAYIDRPEQHSEAAVVLIQEYWASTITFAISRVGTRMKVIFVWPRIYIEGESRRTQRKRRP